MAVCRSRCQRTRARQMKRRSPDLAPAHAPAAFHRFRQRTANARQTYGSYRCDNSVFPPPAPADCRVPPALATLTSSCLNTAPTAAYPASRPARFHYRVSPQKRINARSTGASGVSSSRPWPNQRQRKPAPFPCVTRGVVPLSVNARKSYPSAAPVCWKG